MALPVKHRLRILEVAGSGRIGTCDAGPVSSVILELSNGLAAAGHEVVVADAPSDVPRSRLNPAINVVEMSARSLVKDTARLLQQVDVDIIHTHDGDKAITFGRAARVPLMWTAHGLNWTLDANPALRRLGIRSWRARRLDLAACRSVDRIVVLNAQTQAALSQPGVTVIPNGIDLGKWPPVDRTCARRHLGIDAEEFRVTFVGRIAPVKGVDVFVRAIDKVAAEIPVSADAIGSLSGKFGNTSVITRYARRLRAGSSQVTFQGFCHRDGPEYRQRLAAADLVVVPSITEPFGLVVLEALACGARVLGSDVGGIRDMLQGGVGRLVPPGDVEALAQAILDEATQKSAGNHANPVRETLENYSWGRIGQAYANLMCSMSAGALA